MNKLFLLSIFFLISFASAQYEPEIFTTETLFKSAEINLAKCSEDSLINYIKNFTRKKDGKVDFDTLNIMNYFEEDFCQMQTILYVWVDYTIKNAKELNILPLLDFGKKFPDFWLIRVHLSYVSRTGGIGDAYFKLCMSSNQIGFCKEK